MEQLAKQTFNELMDEYKAAVATMTPAQIAACAYVMGASGCGWNKETITAELEAEKHDA